MSNALGYRKGRNQTSQSKSKKTKHSDSLAQVQNVKSARVYVFGNDNIQEDSEEELELSEIRSRKGPSSSQVAYGSVKEEELIYERTVADGDTLQSLSLLYAIPISEIKRANNLMSNQEFFAMNTVKIPVKKHGILSELVKQNESENVDSKRERKQVTPAGASALHEVENFDQYFGEEHTETESQSKEAERFLDEMDKDVTAYIQARSQKSSRNSLDEVISVLTNKTTDSLLPVSKAKNGADCGITWKNIVITIIVVCIIIPLFFLGHYIFS